MALHLQRASRQGRAPAELVGPPLPDDLAHVWRWFDAELSPARPCGFTEQPLAWQEIDAWARRTGVRLSSADARLLRALDVAYLNAVAAGSTPPAAAKDPHGRTPR